MAAKGSIAYFKQKQTETSMSEEQKEKGILDKIVSLIKGSEQEPVQDPVAEVPSVDFEMKFNELEVEMKAQLEAKSSELAEIKASHDEAIAKIEADHKAELEEVVAKVEVVAKAFEDGVSSFLREISLKYLFMLYSTKKEESHLLRLS